MYLPSPITFIVILNVSILILILWRMFRLLDTSYPLLPTHTSPDANIFSYLLLVRLPSLDFWEKRTSGPYWRNVLIQSQRNSSTQQLRRLIQPLCNGKSLGNVPKNGRNPVHEQPCLAHSRLGFLLKVHSPDAAMNMTVYDNIHCTRYMTVFWSTMNNLNEKNGRNSCTFVNCGHLKNFFTAPWLKNWVEYSYLLPKYSVKISREKKMGVFFLFHFL